MKITTLGGNMRKTIVITGASRGIGKAIALSFAGKDINIVINCVKNIEKLNDVKTAIQESGTVCETFVGDISDYNTAEKLFTFVEEHFGGTDILINNAGISIVGLFQDMSRTEWEHIVNINQGSLFNCCHFAVPHMIRKQAGKIINISSVWGLAGASCEVAYSATKGAVNAFTKALAKELAPSNIQVNAIACGAIHTDMNSFLSEDELHMLQEEIPTGRLGEPEEVACVVNHLIDSPTYLTGQIITLDGAWL
jgi:3-oxoacyl-[acyl-carrier protein] reductase